MNKTKLKIFGICILISFSMWILHKKERVDQEQENEKNRTLWEQQQRLDIKNYQELNMLVDSIISRTS